MGRYIILDENSMVIAVRSGSEVVAGEIESENGDVGQIMQQDGTFITPESIPTPPKQSIEERMEQLQQDNLILMDALAMTFEEVLNLKAQLGGTP